MRLSQAGVTTPSKPLSPTTRHLGRLSALAVAVALTACGGGGGGSDTGAVAPPPPAVAGNLATSVPTPSYPAGSKELGMFNQLNDIRKGGNFGMLAQDPALDKAALAHANYVVINYMTAPYANTAEFNSTDAATGFRMAHVERVGRVGFTGILPLDRIQVAGAQYAYSGEVAAGGGNNPADCIPKLLNSVFHRNAMLNTAAGQVGFGYLLEPTGFSSVCVIEPAYKTAAVRPSDWIGIYPTDGQTGVPADGQAGKIEPGQAPEGSPVSIYVDQDLTVTSFTLMATGASVPVKPITAADFPGYLGRKEAHIMPAQVLASGTRYNVSFRGVLADGKNVVKDWSFTTK